MPRPNALERFEAQHTPEPNSGCWLWIGARTTAGYGEIMIDGKLRYAHRAAYELLIGPIPDGLQLDHLCRMRCCVNPAHLEPVTNRENVMRGVGPQMLRAKNQARTHCKRGHPFDEANTYWVPNGRACKECMRMHARNTKRRHARRQMEA